MTQIGERMARSGLRWTVGRRSVVECFQTARAPLSIQDLGEVAHAVPVPSLYRIVSDLVAAGVLARLDFQEGFARFELMEDLAQHHHHLVCTGCGSVQDLGSPRLDRLELAVTDAVRHIRRRQRFVVSQHRLDFFGTCSGCLSGS